MHAIISMSDKAVYNNFMGVCGKVYGGGAMVEMILSDGARMIIAG